MYYCFEYHTNTTQMKKEKIYFNNTITKVFERSNFSGGVWKKTQTNNR